MIRSIIVLFLIASTVSFVLCRCSLSTDRSDVVQSKTEKLEEDNKLTEKGSVKPLGKAVPKNRVDTVTQETAKQERKKEKKQRVVSVGKALANPQGAISDKKIGTVLSKIAENLEKKKLAYRANLKQDCSGIFHQIKDSLQLRLPALAASKSNFKYPASRIRSSRQIADWYYKNNNLLLVEDAIASRNAIRPGAVLFFGKSNQKFKNITIDLLTDRDNNYSYKGAINHVAVVTRVSKDAQGNVIGYTMMHGRNSKIPAARSSSKVIQSKYTPDLPPFGNWRQQLLAIANIVTPRS